MKTRTPAEIDYDLKILRAMLLDTVQGSKERLAATTHIDKLLDERLAIVDSAEKISDPD
jgi:hypothetical protein